jgi:signal transduction histidine kinase/DNA-binding response OmpR family regulator
MITPAVLGKIGVGPGDDEAAAWDQIRALAAGGGLPPLAAARLALAAVELIGSPHGPATVEVVAVSGGEDAHVQAVVHGGSGRSDGPAARLADSCRPHTTASGAVCQIAAVTAGQQATAQQGRPSWRDPLGQAAKRGSLTALLAAALIGLDDQAGRLAEYDTEVGELRAELDATNQGLLALHAELSGQRDQLAEAHAAAERAAKAKAAFLASMSHEIRSPLNAMIGFTSLLRETELTPEQAEYADTFAAVGSHLKDLVDGILDLSRVESGQLELEEVPFDLVACVEEAAGIVAPQAEDKHLALAALVAPGLPATVAGDPLRLRQILVNLLSNAVKFTDRGEVTIGVSALPGAAGECRLAFGVHDSGPGIPASALGKLFDPFTQADAGTARRFGGTGLGLTISKQLAECMGGQLAVESTPGHGATFTATIPLRQPVPELSGGAPDHPLSGVHVLLVHPKPTIAEAARQHLAAWGATITVATSAAGAAGRAAEWADAALAVIGTSQPAGLPAAISTLTAARNGRPLPVVALTPLTWRPAASPVPLTWTVTATPVRQARLREAVLGALGHAEPAGGTSRTGPAPGPAQGLRILVAEDDPANQRAISGLLRRLGHRADLAGDGEQAVAAISQGDYDLVLMDVNMPRLDGIAATRQVRAQRPGKHPPIVALTASATSGTRRACLRAGMTGFLTKPCQPADLAALVTSITRQESSAAAPPAGARPVAARPAPAGPVPAGPAPIRPAPGLQVPGVPAPGEPAPGEPAAGRRAGQPESRQAAATTVLYVDENPTLRGLAERILVKDPAISVLTAADADTGLDQAIAHQPDLILVDPQLSGTPGETLIARLQGDERTSGIPIVVVSGDTSPAAIKRVTSLGATGYLAKPFDAEDLRAIVATAAGRPAAAAPMIAG